MVKGKTLNFIKSNLRYSKYQVFVISFLFIVAAALINTFLFLSFNYNSFFGVEKDRLCGEDIDFLYLDAQPQNSKNDILNDTLSNISCIKDFEIDRVVSNNGNAEFKDGILTHKITYMKYSHALDKDIGKYEILEDEGGSGVYLSYLFKSDGGYKTGDEITITMGTKKETFRICGFYHNVDTGSMNCTDIAFLLTDDCYKKVEAYGVQSYRLSILLNEPEKAQLIESDIARSISDAAPSLTPLRSSTAIRLATSRYVTSSMFQAIISVTALLMTAVVLGIIAITLTNYIRNNMKNLGTLKAVGYKSNDLIVPIVAEFAVIAAITSTIGVLLSYLILPSLNTALERQVGIPYHISFMLPEALISVAVCIVSSAIVTLISVMKIKGIAPILAIRDSKSRDGAKKNLFSLDKTHFNLNTALSFKAWVSAKSRNIVILLSIAGISFLIGFSCFIYQNTVIDSSYVMSLVFGSVSDSVLSTSDVNEENLINELEENTWVKDYYMYTTYTITPDDLPKLYAYVYDDESALDEDRICVKGNLPQNDMEIAVNAAYAKKQNLSVGDSLCFTQENSIKCYTVCGLTQGAFNSGFDGYLSREGYSRLAPISIVNYYVNLNDGVDIDNFNSEIASKCDLIYCSNYRSTTETSANSYKNILSIASVVVVIVSFLICGFILYILISVYLSNERRNHGILKSLGFVTKDIIYQTVVSIIPTSLVAVIIGLTFAKLWAADVLILALKNMGIFSFGSQISTLLLALAGVGIMLFTILYTVLLSNSVRKITPRQLFNKE